MEMDEVDDVCTQRNKTQSDSREGLTAKVITTYNNNSEIGSIKSRDHPGYQYIIHSDGSLVKKDLSIAVRDVSLIFQCIRCNDNPLSPPVYICLAGHQTCNHCFSNCDIECIFCHQTIIGCNEYLEKVIRNMHPITLLKLSQQTVDITLSDDEIEQNDKMELYDPGKLDHYKSIGNTQLDESSLTDTQHEIFPSEPSLLSPLVLPDVHPMGIDTQTTTDIFRMPVLPTYMQVTCPVQKCRIPVSISAFINHFKFTHPLIPIITVDNDTNYKITINPTTFKDNNLKCLIMYLVPYVLPVSPCLDKKVTDSKVSPTELFRQNEKSIPCLVLASKFTYGIKSDSDARETFFVVWTVCLNQISPVYYTVEAVNTVEKLHTVAFSGPIAMLRKPQTVDEVVRGGNCLLVTPGQLKRLTDCTGEFDISVKFHLIAV